MDSRIPKFCLDLWVGLKAPLGKWGLSPSVSNCLRQEGNAWDFAVTFLKVTNEDVSGYKIGH